MGRVNSLRASFFISAITGGNLKRGRGEKTGAGAHEGANWVPVRETKNTRTTAYCSSGRQGGSLFQGFSNPLAISGRSGGAGRKWPRLSDRLGDIWAISDSRGDHNPSWPANARERGLSIWRWWWGRRRRVSHSRRQIRFSVICQGARRAEGEN